MSLNVKSSLGSIWDKDSWVRPYIRKYKPYLIGAIALSVLALLFGSGMMFVSGYMISLAASIPMTVLALHLPSIFVRIFGIGKPILSYFDRLMEHDWVLRATSSIRQRLYDALEKRGDTVSGKYLSLFADDIESVQNLFLRTLFPLFTLWIVWILISAAMGILSPVMGLALFVLLGLEVLALPFVAVSVCGALADRSQSLKSHAYDISLDDIHGCLDWRLSGRKDEFVGRMMRPYEELSKTVFRSRRRLRWLGLPRRIISALVIVCVFVWAASVFGADGVFEGADGLFATGFAVDVGNAATLSELPYPANWIAAFVLCLFPLLEAFSNADSAAMGFADARTPLNDLKKVDGGCSYDASGDARLMDFDAKEALRNDLPRGSIRLNGVSCIAGNPPFDEAGFDGCQDRRLVCGIDLAVNPGEHVGIMGRSGVGKTTLLNIILGNKDVSSGEVNVAGKVGIVEQSPYIFAKSLRENLLLAKPTAKDDELLSVLDRVELRSFVEGLPNGLDSQMAERGLSVSGGEAHRIALARILLAECDIVLLDEPYNALDDDTRFQVSKTLMEALGDKTIVLVTHDKRDLSGFDRVIMLSSSGIVG